MFYGRWEEMLKGEIGETVEILHKLKRKKIKLIALTNWSAETFPVAVKKFKFLKLFDGIVVSGKVKMLKPFPEIYNYTLKKYGLIANKSIFIDDRISNVDGAIKCGINGIQFVSPKNLIIALKKYGIKI
jgi:2-haloacid dehalogenase